MRSIGFAAWIILALAAMTGGAAAQTLAGTYRIGLLSAVPDPTDQSPFGAGLIRSFAIPPALLARADDLIE
jgi:hypothetical protein